MGRTALPIKHAGSIEHDVRNRTWRVKMELNRKTHTGPRRSSKAEAKSDQAKGRRTASRKAFAVVLRQLTLNSGYQTSRSSAPQLASLKPKKMSSKPDKAQTRFRKNIEGGPPKIITEVFETHFRATVNRTKKFAKEARAILGW